MSVLRFGTFEVDTQRCELRDRGRPVHLQDMPLRVLLMLLEQPGQLIPRETFFAQLWPHDESGMLDDNLNTAVRKLRLALNDSAHKPQFIETVPKRGYRFVATVVDDAAVTAASLPDIERAPATPWRKRVILGTLAALAAGVLMFTLFAPQRIGERAPGERVFDSVAVLPLVNASGDPGNQYFSDGLTEEIMDQLARGKRLRVVSRTSTFALDTAKLNAREIGARLQADALLEGSVRRNGDRLRVNLRLVDSADGYQLWSRSYDRPMRDVLNVQHEIAVAVVRELANAVPPAITTTSLPEISSQAYDHYLQGRYFWHRRTERDLLEAARNFESTVSLAPAYARAWAGLADAFAVLGFYDYLLPKDAFPRARIAAGRALSLEPDNADAEATLGYVALYFDWDLAQAEAHFQRSIALRPDLSKAHQWYGNLLTAAGRFDEAESALRRAQQLEPLSLIASAALGWSRFYARRYEQALEQLELTIALDSEFELAYLWAGVAEEALGRHEKAYKYLEDTVVRSGGSGISIAALARLQALRGERQESERLLTELTAVEGYVPAYEIAKAYLALEKSDQALAWLRRAYNERSHSMVFIAVDPQLDAIRDNVEFIRLAAQVRPDVLARQ